MSSSFLGTPWRTECPTRQQTGTSSRGQTCWKNGWQWPRPASTQSLRVPCAAGPRSSTTTITTTKAGSLRWPHTFSTARLHWPRSCCLTPLVGWFSCWARTIWKRATLKSTARRRSNRKIWRRRQSVAQEAAIRMAVKRNPRWKRSRLNGRITPSRATLLRAAAI